MIWIAAKLLGLKSLILDNWKILIPVALVLAGFFYTKEHYYSAGKTDEKAYYESLIKTETSKNAALTSSIANLSTNYGVLAAKEDKVRIQKENTHEQKIQTIIQENPVYNQCVIDKSVLEEQNAIKALGPK
jgi:hypothetical protein